MIPGKLLLKSIFAIILLCMLVVTTWATFQENVFVGGGKLIRAPWGIATLFDAYFGFLTFFIWLAYRERSLAVKVCWFILIMLLGNIAMSFYMLKELFALPVDSGIEDLLKKKRQAL